MCLATTPSYGHPSFPKEGTTQDAFFMFFPLWRLSFGPKP